METYSHCNTSVKYNCFKAIRCQINKIIAAVNHGVDALTPQTIHDDEMLSSALKTHHTTGHLFKSRNSDTNVRPHSIHSRTKVRAFATSLFLRFLRSV